MATVGGKEILPFIKILKKAVSIQRLMTPDSEYK